MNEYPAAILALDAGQTGIRSILIDGDTRVEKKFDGLKTHIDLFPQLTAVINAALAEAPDDVTVALGMTGLTDSQSKPQELLGKPAVNCLHFSRDPGPRASSRLMIRSP